MNNKVYDSTKWVAMIGLPAVGTLYVALAAIWGLPSAEQVLATVTAVDLFLGAILGLAARNYTKSGARYDGTMEIEETDSSLIHGLELTTPPEELGQKKEVIFKLQPKHVKPYDA